VEVALQECGNTFILRSFVICAVRRHCYDIVTCIPNAKQRLGKQILAEADTPKSRTSIAMQRISKHASLTIESMFSEWSVQSRCKEVFGSIERYRTVVELETPACREMSLELN
jgi:hypothetical protein